MGEAMTAVAEGHQIRRIVVQFVRIDVVNVETLSRTAGLACVPVTLPNGLGNGRPPNCIRLE